MTSLRGWNGLDAFRGNEASFHKGVLDCTRFSSMMRVPVEFGWYSQSS